MKTVMICVTILVSVLGASLIIGSALVIDKRPANPNRPSTSTFSKEEIQKAVEKVFARLPNEVMDLKEAKVTEIRTNDAETKFRVYCVATFKNGETDNGWMEFNRDEFGVWSNGYMYDHFIPGNQWFAINVTAKEKR